MRRLLKSILLALGVVLLMATPVLAISNPDAIAFYAVGSSPVYKVHYNILESGDMLFSAEQYVHYVVTPNETAEEAFLFEVLNTSANDTIASVTLKQYEAKPIGIYMSASQVTTAGISVGDNLTIRIIGNPLLFASSTNNTVSAVLAATDYVDQALGEDGGIPSANELRNFMIQIALHLETHDAPATSYITLVSGYYYLTSAGASIFLEGIPGLDSMSPILFQYSTAPMQGDTPESTGAYASTLSPLAKWGQTSADGLTNLGLYLGLNQALAGSVMLIVLVASLAVFTYSRLQSGVAVLLLIGTTPFLGAWLGLMPIALAFIFTIILVVLLGYFFFSRGAL